jgi:hypothetical protein
MLVKDGVDDDRHNGSQVGLSCNFNEYDNESTSLEDSTAS